MSGQVYVDGKEVTLKTVKPGIDAGLGFVTEDRKSLGLNLLDDIKATTVSADLGEDQQERVVDANKEFAVAEQYRKSLRTKAPSVFRKVSRSSPAATSRRWCWRSGCSRTRTC